MAKATKNLITSDLVVEAGRRIIAQLIAPTLADTGFRFSKDYRWGTTKLHRAIYALVDTVDANNAADAIARQGA